MYKNNKLLANWYELDIPELEFIATDNVSFDNICGGFQKGGITVLTACSGEGKSLLLTHFASLLSKTHTIQYISMENMARIDLNRFKEAIELYGGNPNNIGYVNASYEDDYRELLNEVFYSVGSGEWADCVFIDGAELTMDTGSEGNKLYASGNELMKRLIAEIGHNNPNACVVMSWQLNREAMSKKIEEVDTSMIANSLGAVRYASAIYCIKHNTNETKKWQIRLLKSRTEANWNNSTISVDYNDKLDLRNKSEQYPITTDEALTALNNFKKMIGD